MLEQYPGLSLPYQLVWGAGGAGIPGIDWLTVIGDGALALAGGVEALRARLDDAAKTFGNAVPEVIGYPGGVVVRAGETPLLDDPETGRAPREYRAVDAALRELRWDGRSSKPSAQLKVGSIKGLDPAEVTLRWVTRFE